MKAIKKGLTFRASSIGDCLMGKYLLDNIHEQFPNARLGIVVASRATMIRDLFASLPWIEVTLANRRSPWAILTLIIKFFGSDVVVTQYAGKKGGVFSLSSKLMARVLAKLGGLVGFTDASKWNRVLYDQLIPLRFDTAIADREREALKSLGLSISVPYPRMHIEENYEMLNKFNLGLNEYIVVHLFAGNKTRGLHPDNKRELLMSLSQKFPHLKLVITGGDDDREEALTVSKGINALVIAGEVTLQEMMHVLSYSLCVVSIDTGVAHLAAQFGKRLVVMRSCVGRQWWLPEQYGHHAPIKVYSRDDLCPSGHVEGDYPACLNEINLHEVVNHSNLID